VIFCKLRKKDLAIGMQRVNSYEENRQYVTLKPLG